MFFSPIIPGRFLWNSVRSFPNKFSAKWHKRFPPHLNNVSTLPCEIWNAHCAYATIELLQKETSEFMPPQQWSPTSPDLNALLKELIDVIKAEKQTSTWDSQSMLHSRMSVQVINCYTNNVVKFAYTRRTTLCDYNQLLTPCFRLCLSLSLCLCMSLCLSVCLCSWRQDDGYNESNSLADTALVLCSS